MLTYLAGSWLLIQVAETLLPVYGFGDTVIRATVAVLVIGFIPAVLISWMFQRTSGGLKKQSDLDASDSTAAGIAQSDDDIVLAVLPFDNLSNDPETQLHCSGSPNEYPFKVARLDQSAPSPHQMSS